MMLSIKKSDFTSEFTEMCLEYTISNPPQAVVDKWSALTVQHVETCITVHGEVNICIAMYILTCLWH